MDIDSVTATVSDIERSLINGAENFLLLSFFNLRSILILSDKFNY
jgi:hypothetical protein